MSTGNRVGLIADKDAYFRVAAAAILTQHFDFTEIVEASSFDEALEHLTENGRIGTALLDLSMQGAQTPTNLRSIRECFPSVHIAVISASASRGDILAALEAGVHGYMLKSFPVAELVKALGILFDGGVYVPPCLAEISGTPVEPIEPPQLIEVSRPQQDVHHTAPTHLLTARQRDVLDLLVQGKTNKEIALVLKLGEGTVKIHMAAIFRYFGVNNRAAAAVAGARPYPNRPRGILNGWQGQEVSEPGRHRMDELRQSRVHSTPTHSFA
jgi:DNA-binding NarL/FixJ family response regulator